MSKRPQDTSAEEPDGGNPHIRFRGGPRRGNSLGLLNSKSPYPLKLPPSIKNATAELAASDGVSPDQFIVAAVAEKVGCLRTAREFLRERAGSAKPKDVLKYLRRAPKVPPADDGRP